MKYIQFDNLSHTCFHICACIFYFPPQIFSVYVEKFNYDKSLRLSYTQEHTLNMRIQVWKELYIIMMKREKIKSF